MIQVAIDGNGYAYEIETGYLVNVAYDEGGVPFDAETGEEIQFVRVDPATTQNGNSRPIYTDISDDVKDVLVAIFGNENQRFSGNRLPVNQAPAGAPILTTPRSMIPQVQASSSGVGFNISTNTLIFIAGGILLFMVGQNRGRGR